MDGAIAMAALISSATVALGQAAVPALLPSSAEIAGSYRWQSGGFIAPVSCAISKDGVVAVADAGGALVALDSNDGSVRWKLSEFDGGPMLEPAGVTSRADGSFLVTDMRRRRVDHVSASGEWIGRFASQVALSEPSAIACSTSKVAMLDGATGEIAICDNAGAEISRILADSVKSPDGRRLEIAALAFIDDTHLALAAGSQNAVAIVRLDPGSAPRVEKVFGGRGPFPGFFNQPVGIAAASGWLFVADQFNHRVARHTLDGKGQLAYGQHAVLPRAGEGAVHYPVAIAVSPDALAVVCEPFERRVQAYTPNFGAEPVDMRLVLPKLEGIQSHFGASATRAGQRLFLHDPESASVIVFDLSKGQPVHVSTLGAPGAKGHEFGQIDALLALDNGTRLLVADSGNRRLALWELTPPPKEIIFEPFMGRLVKTRPYDRLPLAPRATIASLALDTDGSILALDADGPALVRLDRSLRSATREALVAPDTTARAVSIASAIDGELGVLFDRPASLVTFARGAAEGAWSLKGSRPIASCNNARALAALGDGAWAVVDEWGDQVLALSSDLSERRLSQRGVADGECWLPSALAIGDGGAIYLVDTGNHRGQRFDGTGKWEMTFSLGRTYTRARSSDEVLRVKRQPAAAPQTPAPAAGGPS